jgi:hypothetical protein
VPDVRAADPAVAPEWCAVDAGERDGHETGFAVGPADEAEAIVRHVLVFAFDHWIFHPLVGRGYQFWSGIGGGFMDLALCGWLYAFLRKHNCHTKGCWRIGRHVVEGTPFVVCRKHHPDGKPTVDEIHGRAR